MKKEDINDIKKWIILLIIGIFVYWSVFNFNIILEIISKILKVFYPFILGGIIAFILNIIMKRIEYFLNKNINLKKKKKLIRAISITLSLLIFIGVIIFIAFLLIPELIENIKLLINNIPVLINKAEIFALDLLDKYPDAQIQIEKIFEGMGSKADIISNLLDYIVNGAVKFVSSLVSGFITIFTALIFSIYMLIQKEYLLKSIRKLIYACFDKETSDRIIETGIVANKMFSKFISGQCVEAVILGTIIFIVSLIFKFPYALIIAVITTITALIPIFGAFIALILGAILIGISNPIQALIFIIAFLIIQQIEGNLIYPKVVGASVGLSPLWTLLAVTVGGNLFGIMGMIIGLPLASILYSLLKTNINKKLKEKNIIVS